MIIFLFCLYIQSSKALLTPQEVSLIPNESGGRESNETVRLYVPPGVTDTVPTYTFHVTIFVKDSANSDLQYCSGALVTTSIVVTSASCVIRGSALTVVAGVTDGANGGTTPATPITVSEVILYPKYQINSMKYDIALLRLASPVTLSGTISIATLPTSSGDYKDPKDFQLKTFRVVGFNLQADAATWATATPVTRSYGDMTVLTSGDCSTLMKSVHFHLETVTQSCFSNTYASGATVGACKGDLGAPVISIQGTNLLVGVITYYRRCGETTIFTRIGPMLSWIKQYVTQP